MMFRATIVFSVVCAMTAAFVSAAPFEHHDDHHDDHHDGHHGSKKTKVNAGGDSGLLNINPGHHLILDDLKLKHVLNDVLDINIIRLQEVLKNVALLSGNGAHYESDHHDEYNHEDYHHTDFWGHDDNDDNEDHDDEDC